MESMMSSASVADQEVEVSSRATRRVFTAKYKERILREADAAAKERGGVAALLRREGLYSSHLTAWRKEVRAALGAKKRGPKSKVTPEDRRIAELERKVERLTKRAEQAEAMVALQKKLAQILEAASDRNDEEKKP